MDNLPPGAAWDLAHQEQQQSAYEAGEAKAYEIADEEIGAALGPDEVKHDDIELVFFDYDKDGDLLFDVTYKPTGYETRITVGNPMYPDEPDYWDYDD